MSQPVAIITAIGTYLPTWGNSTRRLSGHDEDAVTMAVAAGLAALDNVHPTQVRCVIFVTRNFPLLEGGNSAALLAGLGLSNSTMIREVVGGAPVVLDSITSAEAGTLIIGSEPGDPAAASAIFVGTEGAALVALERITRSMPVTTRDSFGNTSDYSDARLLRVSGLGVSLESIGSPIPVATAGLDARDSAAICGRSTITLPTTGAASVGFLLAALISDNTTGTVLAAEQATLSLAELQAGAVRITRDEPSAQPLPNSNQAPGSSVSISLSAYDRAFEFKLRLEAAACSACGSLSYPRRRRCINCGSEEPTTNTALPRDGEIYSMATIRVPVPGLIGPYTVVIVDLGDSGVRTMVRLTAAPPGSVKIGDKGRLALRLVAVRMGVPDYGYGFIPESATHLTEAL